MKVEYVIRTVMDEQVENWDVKTNEEMLAAIKEYIKDDPDYVLGGLDQFTIEVKLID